MEYFVSKSGRTLGSQACETSSQATTHRATSYGRHLWRQRPSKPEKKVSNVTSSSMPGPARPGHPSSTVRTVSSGPVSAFPAQGPCLPHRAAPGLGLQPAGQPPVHTVARVPGVTLQPPAGVVPLLPGRLANRPLAVHSLARPHPVDRSCPAVFVRFVQTVSEVLQHKKPEFLTDNEAIRHLMLHGRTRIPRRLFFFQSCRRKTGTG